MFKRKNIEGLHVRISICKDVIEAIFDECDKYNVDETGGRIIGYCQYHDAKLNIDACGLIGPGPNARRSSTSFFQDGEYQEAIFRKIEAQHPDIEHLGNWHTHHVNGLNMLSSGDIDTYKRIVNHEKHNTDFFYALLVVAKTHSYYSRKRYVVKHFLLRRGESLIYEIPSSKVKIVKNHPVFIDKTKEEALKENSISDTLLYNHPTVTNIRSRDREVMSYMCPDLKPFFSKQTRSLYWKGKLTLINDTSVELLMLESLNEARPSYSITFTGLGGQHFQCRQLYLKRTFDSAWKAICSLERDLNHEIFGAAKNKRLSN